MNFNLPQMQRLEKSYDTAVFLHYTTLENCGENYVFRRGAAHVAVKWPSAQGKNADGKIRGSAACIFGMRCQKEAWVVEVREDHVFKFLF